MIAAKTATTITSDNTAPMTTRPQRICKLSMRDVITALCGICSQFARHGDDKYYSRMYHIAVDDYVVDVLLPDLAGHDRSPAAFLVYLILWTHLFRSERRSVEV